ncbi:MAG: hypothetical protein DIJKHBIC_04169 [Thermoanaerobaculia bacterium]|nr:hypothetical protein [Thermoanaerobaculia bacterium]
MAYKKKAKQILVSMTEAMFENVASLAEESGRRLGEMSRVLISEALEMRAEATKAAARIASSKGPRIDVDPSRALEVWDLARKEGITASEAAGRLAEQEGIPVMASIRADGSPDTFTTLPKRDPSAKTRSEAEKIARGVVMVQAAVNGTVLSDEEIEERIRSMAESLELLVASGPAPRP